MNNEINYVSPFKRFCITVGNLPTAYIESMSYYEGLTYLVNYLSNNVIPALNNNGLVVEEVQQKFEELENYVNTYFDNLDLQEEVNIKLDEMAADGTLEQLIFFDNIIYATRPGHNLEPMNFDNSDETDKLQAIIDWALENNGAKILLPTGQTKISTISISTNGAINIEIVGMGHETIINSITNNNEALFDINATDNIQIDNFILDNFALIGNDEQINVTAINLNNVCNNSEIKNLLIENFNIGLKLTKCWTIKVLNNNFYHNNEYGLYATSQCHNITIYGNKISYNSNVGLYLQNSYELNVENNDVEDNRAYGIQCNSTRNLNLLKNYIENNGISNASTYNEIYLEADCMSPNIMFNYINANTVTNAIQINPESTNINISNNIFTSGSNLKKVVKCNGNTGQIQGKFENNITTSYGSDFTKYDFGNSQFIVDELTHNQEYHQSNQAIFKRLVANNGAYAIRIGKDNIVKFELNYDTNDNPIINVTSGAAGSEEYKKIITLQSDLNVKFRKTISFETLLTNADITNNNCLFVATNGELRFKDKDGNVHVITMS